MKVVVRGGYRNFGARISRALAGEPSSIEALGSAFHRDFRIWFALGWPAFAGVLVLFALMVGRGFFASP
jgi:uncharacterized membrane protein